MRREEELIVAKLRRSLWLRCALAVCVTLVFMTSAQGQSSDKPDQDAGKPEKATLPTAPTPPQVISEGQPAVAVQPERVAGKPGCGKKGSKLDLTPPPEDQPQPKFVCAQPTVTVDPVWQGVPVKSEFVVSNGGAGPLHINLRGG